MNTSMYSWSRWMLVLLVGGLCSCSSTEDAPASAPPTEQQDPCVFPTPDTMPAVQIHTPRWAFEPWISKDISDRADTYAFVQGFEERGIPVGVVVLDSPWETHYNTFVPNPSRYPDFEMMVKEFRAKNIRTVLWVTQMVNTIAYDLEQGGDTYEGASPNYQKGEECGYFINDGDGYQWWKGKGSAVDFFNPQAATWWHRQQDALLEMGVAGWKLDFGESYITASSLQTAAGEKTLQEYSEKYYEDFYTYGANKLGTEEFVTMVRPWDESYQFAGRFHARKEHAPVCWVGDNRRDWVGLQDALDHIFRSAQAGYVMLGSDIGGYLDKDDKDLLGKEIPFDTLNFARWTAFGALTPFMQLHGRANITPWTVPDHADETVAIYKYWATLHHEMIPFFYSLAEESYAGKGKLLQPEGELSQWANDYRFHLGNALFVAPVLDDSGKRDVVLPAGHSYYDWWSSELPPAVGGQTLKDVDTSDRTKIPLYVKSGAILPMTVGSSITGIGKELYKDWLTVLIYPSTEATTFVVHDEDQSTTEIKQIAGTDKTTISLSRLFKTTMLRVYRDTSPQMVSTSKGALTLTVTKEALEQLPEGYWFDNQKHKLWIKLAPSTSPAELTVTP
jgi:alpha-glucosidase (family GH31 glycosyl hydrolase)